jgi:hypothetical protein
MNFSGRTSIEWTLYGTSDARPDRIDLKKLL